MTDPPRNLRAHRRDQHTVRTPGIRRDIPQTLPRDRQGLCKRVAGEGIVIIFRHIRRIDARK